MSLIRITKNAHKMLVEINKQYKKDYISFGIKSGGCSGFQYILEPCNKKPKPAKVREPNHTTLLKRLYPGINQKILLIFFSFVLSCITNYIYTYSHIIIRNIIFLYKKVIYWRISTKYKFNSSGVKEVVLSFEIRS